MIMLLVSIFFSGFFLPPASFEGFMQPLIQAIPLTHGIQGFQSLLLKGETPSIWNWIFLALISIIAYIFTQSLFRRQLRHI